MILPRFRARRSGKAAEAMKGVFFVGDAPCLARRDARPPVKTPFVAPAVLSAKPQPTVGGPREDGRPCARIPGANRRGAKRGKSAEMLLGDRSNSAAKRNAKSRPASCAIPARSFGALDALRNEAPRAKARGIWKSRISRYPPRGHTAAPVRCGSFFHPPRRRKEGGAEGLAYPRGKPRGIRLRCNKI